MTNSEKWCAYVLYCEITGQKPSHYEALRNFTKFCKEELESLRKENAKLKANITNLVTKLANLEAKYKKEVRVMENKKTKEITYTKDQVISLVTDVLVEVTVKLKDPSLVIAGMLACDILNEKLK